MPCLYCLRLAFVHSENWHKQIYYAVTYFIILEGHSIRHHYVSNFTCAWIENKKEHSKNTIMHKGDNHKIKHLVLSIYIFLPFFFPFVLLIRDQMSERGGIIYQTLLYSRQYLYIRFTDDVLLHHADNKCICFVCWHEANTHTLTLHLKLIMQSVFFKGKIE